jgi:hypothetical protein
MRNTNRFKNNNLKISGPTAKFEGATAPAVTGKPSGVSPRYRHIDTAAALAVFEKHGWLPTESSQKRRRLCKDGTPSTKTSDSVSHIVELHNPVMTAQYSGETRALGNLEPRLYIRNSHDGSSSFHVMVGFLRLVCLNGLCVGDQLGGFSVRHTGSGISDLELKLAAVAETFKELTILFQKLNGVESNYTMCMQLALKGLVLKYGENTVQELHDKGYLETVLVNLSASNRKEDEVATVWNVVNRIQENLVMAIDRMPKDVTGLNRTRKIGSTQRRLDFTAQLLDFAVGLAA